MITIAYYEKNGRSDVREYIESLEVKTRAKVYFVMELLKEKGWHLKYPDTEKVSRDIFALRVEYANNEYRFFYFYAKGPMAVFVHFVHKKSKKLRREDIEKAEKRRKELERIQ
jgi:phage-related protein